MKVLRLAFAATGFVSLAACSYHERTVVERPVVQERTVVRDAPVVQERSVTRETVIER